MRFVGNNFDEMQYYADVYAEVFAEVLGMTIEKGENDECIFVIPDPYGDEDNLKFTAEELLAIQIRHIKSLILDQCSDADFSKVVIIVPSIFNKG